MPDNYYSIIQGALIVAGILKKEYDNHTSEIDLSENAVYIVKDGEMVKAPEPTKGFGALTINWQGGKPCHGKNGRKFQTLTE